MNEKQYRDWMKKNGYTDICDWNYQTINGNHLYFIKHVTEDKYALIKQIPYNLETKQPESYEVLIEGWTDYNGWKEGFK